MNSFVDAFSKHALLYAEAVNRNTWGHLMPQKQRKYYGYILFSLTSYGDFVVIDDEFEDLDSNPWYYDDLHDFINRWLEEKGEKGHLYRFDGTYVKFKNENFRFSGKVKEVKL